MHRRSRWERVRVMAAAAVVTAGTLVALPQAAHAAVTGPPPQASAFDHVLYWNSVFLDTIRTLPRDGVDPQYSHDGDPTRLARAGAMLHIALHDANWPAAPVTYLPKITQQNPNDSIEATMDAAAHRVLEHLYPYIDFDANLAYALAQIPSSVPSSYVQGGRADGERIGDLMIAERSGDGPAFDLSYTEGTVPGAWRQTGSGPAVTPNWGKLKPFAMTSPTQFRPPPPGGFTSYDQLVRSSQYAQQVNEVKAYGGAKSPTSRSADQTQAAFFWANDGKGTYRPVGQLFAITQTVAKQRGLRQNETAELFNLVSMALADASIVAWGAKFDTPIDLWRPESAIKLADTSLNPAITPDPSWEPLSVNTAGQHFSPPFPSYVSGHATFAGAWAGVMQRWFGHTLTFTAPTDDPNANPKTRTFTSFEQAAEEDALSRLWLGVHYRWDADSGLDAGFNLGDFVYVTKRDQG
ncbi:vanadium-dependent haloperoxidase [Microbispora sp. KK1-11]|uniref:vanadium-dependent haloperoxidase n=1 Tax=Microbispora sp. KK1-11 TaxID=2053005 RepID=UPI00115BF9A9|nr:vanadium-dependent haloperoxidase [Microbispora sp. KK1-11]TQS28934.1 vanadium-dependent haloperoxidase [Microbispora sp. KK1-11]